MNEIKLLLKNFTDYSRVEKFIFVTTCLLAIFIAIPHTIALRLFLESLLLLFTVYYLFKLKKITINPPFILVVLILFWIVFHTLFLTHQPDYSYREINSQRIRPIMLFFVAFFLSQIRSWQLLLSAFISGLVVIIITHFFTALYKGLLIGGVPWQYTIMGHEKHDISLLNNLLYGIALVFFINRFNNVWQNRRRLTILIIFFVFYLLFNLLLLTQINARNGFIGFIGLTVTVLILTGYDSFKKFQLRNKFFIVCSLLFFLGVALTISIKTDKRWNYFIDSALLAVQSDTFKEYKSIGAFPKSANKRIDGSAFERVTMIKEGILLSFRYPMGYSIGRATYDTLMLKEYGVKRQQSTHSSIIDWTLEVGYVGLILWLALLYSIFKPTFVGWRYEHNRYDLIGCVIILGFFSRSLFDAIVMRTHFFEMFMFVLGVISSRIAGKTFYRNKL